MSHSSSSSLLHQHRPGSLSPPQLNIQTAVSLAQAQAEARWLETHERTQQQLCKLSGNSVVAPKTIQREAAPAASAGLTYLSMEPVAGHSTDHAVGDVPSPFSEVSDSFQSFVNRLTSAQSQTVGDVMSRDLWQPDASSALCTFPLCTANFAQTSYFFLRHRRHHCRMCGQIFCSAHSSQRAPLTQSKRNHRSIVHARVCDMCVPRPELKEPLVLPGRKLSASDSEPLSDSNHSYLPTPVDEWGCSSSSSIVYRRASVNTIEEPSSLEMHQQLAPIEDWMDKSGVLSLYPLAVNPSHSRSKRPMSPIPAVAPLFAPSLKSRRQAKEKEIQRQTLRQRRLGKHDFWLPHEWGYRHENLDRVLIDEEDSDREIGGVVEDGPIRFRTGALVRTPLTTPVTV
ncbi:uncharacterized protein L203_106254 [Cryptococcus depauperatus CBS 7841]|uniref:Uncharacterized protein n=1 Tax=Cryptococcus depauperatus CBS 7841 TaxID=1295531 RepID=A0A1E3ILZ7_9TREE|nr:hypothetical protein L203_02745 [Cryptococcus depauperatus CBS 7841]